MLSLQAQSPPLTDGGTEEVITTASKLGRCGVPPSLRLFTDGDGHLCHFHGFHNVGDLELCRLLLRVGRLKCPAFLLQDHVLK